MKRLLTIIALMMMLVGVGTAATCKPCECGALAQNVYDYCMLSGNEVVCRQAAFDAYNNCMLLPD